MKKITVSILGFLMMGSLSAQALKVGDILPAVELENLSNSHAIAPSELEGKILLIDFWATWCAPCITGMPHLEELQIAFPEDLKVLAISYEGSSRLERFINNKSYGFTFASDKAEMLRDFFPHRIIPHTVLIDKNGKVLAITRPGEIDKSTIESILTGTPIDLSLKADNIKFDPSADYFNAASGLKEKFEIQPHNADLPSFSKTITTGEYAGRRINLHNFTISGLYRHAFNKSSKRLILDIDPAQVSHEPQNLYNLDIIVSENEKDSLHHILAQKLLSSFSIQAKVALREQEVGVLYQLDSLGLQLEKTTTKTDYEARGDYFSGKGVEVDAFADYLESFGIVDIPVVNETGIQGYHTIDFSFDPENPETFFRSLEAMGLGIKRATRPIEVLVLFEEVPSAE